MDEPEALEAAARLIAPADTTAMMGAETLAARADAQADGAGTMTGVVNGRDGCTRLKDREGEGEGEEGTRCTVNRFASGGSVLSSSAASLTL